MYQKHYSKFLEQNKGVQHFAPHSHYYWPDVTFEAQQQYWKDSIKYVDKKWDFIFSEKVPVAQKHLAKLMGVSKTEQIVFAPNTHELVARLLSCFEPGKKTKILTTDSEFYSFDRQTKRLEEFDNFEITRGPSFPIENFEDRFIEAIKKDDFDLVFFSHVFFNSGIPVIRLEEIVESIQNENTIIAIDGYHALGAIPVDISKIQNRVFYLGGSYKYLQGGEGCCFMYVPPDNDLRPSNTGWFADFENLSSDHSGPTTYSKNGQQFAGATMDFSSLYRLIAVFELFEKEGLTLEKRHAYIQNLQQKFLNEINKYDHPLINQQKLLTRDLKNHGHFFAFELDNNEQTAKMASLLDEFKIQTDFRKNRLRFGFAIYHNGNYDLSILNTRRAYFFDELIFGG
jgi:selenocysteine lyase/cysteine desulfurase